MKILVIASLLALSTLAIADQNPASNAGPLPQDVADRLGKETVPVDVNFAIGYVYTAEPSTAGGPSTYYKEPNLQTLADKLRKNNGANRTVGKYQIESNWGLIKINGNTFVDQMPGYQQYENDRKGDTGTIDYDFAAKSTLVSLVGNVASTIETMWYYEGGAHPSGGTFLQAKDFTTGKLVRLQDIATENSIMSALKSDPYIQKLMSGPKGRAALQNSKTLKDLYAGLTQYSGYATFKDCPGTFSVYEPNQYIKDGSGSDRDFAITGYDAKANKFSVRVTLDPNSEVCRGVVVQLGLMMTPKPSFAGALKQAGSGNGFFADKESLKSLGQ